MTATTEVSRRFLVGMLVGGIILLVGGYLLGVNAHEKAPTRAGAPEVVVSEETPTACLDALGVGDRLNESGRDVIEASADMIDALVHADFNKVDALTDEYTGAASRFQAARTAWDGVRDHCARLAR